MSLSVDNTVAVNINNVSKTYHTKTKDIIAIQKISLDIYKGEFLAIVGPSGCGKTTLLRLIAGLERDYAGNIVLGNKRIDAPGLDRGIIFQEHRLLPWLTIAENVALGLSGNKSFIADKVQHYLKKVGLEEFTNVYPGQLSGGMAQRAAIARALVYQPQVLLLDEPFGALDEQNRLLLQQELLRIWEGSNKTTVFITHSIDEALCLGDRVLVMTARPGEIKTIIPVDLPRPRDIESIRTTVKYNTLYQTIWLQPRDEVFKAKNKER